MKKKFIILSKIFGLTIFYFLVLIASIFLTMSILIKGEELSTPSLIGKSLNEAYQITSSKGIYLKKETINVDKNFKPLTIIDQFPAPNTRVKEKSFIKVYVSMEQSVTILPDLSNRTLEECEKILAESNLKKRFVSSVISNNVPIDWVISQSYPPSSRVPIGTYIDILISKGTQEKSYIMPFIIGMKAEKVVYYFEKMNFQISKITRVPYGHLEPGVVVKQFPSPGFRINPKNLISIQISE